MTGPSAYARAAAAQFVLRIAPPLICSDLVADSTFRETYGFISDAEIVFPKSGVSVQRSVLYKAIREVLSGAPETIVADTVDRSWKLRNESRKGQADLVLSSGQTRTQLAGFLVLSNDREVRLRSFDAAADDVNLPDDAREAWRSVLTERDLEDDEVERYHDDMSDTPVHVERCIRDALAAGQSSISALVPASRRYFERLVGVYDGSESISDYAGGKGRQFLSELSKWRAYDGFLFGLLLSSHAALAAEISVDRLPKRDLVRAYRFIGERGDVLSRLGAIEVGFRILPKRPEVERHVLRLVESIRDDDESDKSSEFRLLAALFNLVDGEIARTRLFSSEPPFYRRLASLAHASLIHRQMALYEIDRDRFSEWAFKARSEQFYYQSRVDMRTEPLWSPDYALAPAMKMDFVGRIIIVGNLFRKHLGLEELRKVVLGEESGSLHELELYPGLYVAGPLEGGERLAVGVPDEMDQLIRKQLKSEVVEPSSFTVIADAALLFRIDPDQADLAAEALRRTRYRLVNVKSKAELAFTLSRLATVAAVSRSGALADELRIVVRRYRHDSQFELPIDDAVRVCLIASACHEDLMAWRDFAGDWLTELAFGELEGDEAWVLFSGLLCLLHAVPELWVSCGKAEAALKGVGPVLTPQTKRTG